jgi:serine protease AprX
VAPKANLANVRVSNAMGASNTSDVVAGLQWIYDHHDQYNIRVVNLALNSSVPEAYHTSPLDAAVEILWFSGIVVVVPAGNRGNGLENGVLYPPANDPFVITVGATDDQGTGTTGDDVMAFFSAYGVTESGFAKPDLVAPGTDIVSLLAKKNVVVYKFHPDHRVDDYYFRMSGTSMASAVTAGAAALLLQDEPSLTPDQVKYRLMATARHFDTPERAGAGYLDIYAAVHRNTTESANTGIAASQLLWTGDDPVVWDSVNWNSVNWSSVNWSSVNWSSVNWSSVNWSSVHWND